LSFDVDLNKFGEERESLLIEAGAGARIDPKAGPKEESSKLTSGIKGADIGTPATIDDDGGTGGRGDR
jgi:hypothetical protein